jgi:hypothetical protein
MMSTEGLEPHLVIKHDPESPYFLLREGTNTLGCTSACEVQLEDASVASQHCQLILEEHRLTVVDQGNGIRVNCEPVDSQVLHPGDVLEVGCYLLVYEGPEPPAEVPARSRVAFGLPVLALAVGLLLGAVLIRIAGPEPTPVREVSSLAPEAEPARLEPELAELREQIDRLTEELASKDEELRGLADAPTAEQLQEAQAQIADLTAERATMAERLDQLTERLDELGPREPEPEPEPEPVPEPVPEPEPPPGLTGAEIEALGDLLVITVEGCTGDSVKPDDLRDPLGELAALDRRQAVEQVLRASRRARELDGTVSQNLDFMQQQVEALEKRAQRGRDRDRVQRLLELSQKKTDDLLAQHARLLGCCQALEQVLARSSGDVWLDVLLERYAALEDPALRRAAVAAFRARRSLDAVPLLVSDLGSRDDELRAAALEALQTITGQDLGPRPGPWNDWLAGSR